MSPKEKCVSINVLVHVEGSTDAQALAAGKAVVDRIVGITDVPNRVIEIEVTKPQILNNHV